MNVSYNIYKSDDTVIILEEPSDIPCEESKRRPREIKDHLEEDKRQWKRNCLKFQRHILPFQQRYNWDCGVACVAMSLSSLQQRYDLYNNLNDYKHELDFGNSTWTIDLCYILRKFNKHFTFHTTFPGVDPRFKDYYFYREILDTDSERVYKRFGEASQMGISVSVKRTHLEEILEHVYLKGPAIVLVNANLLYCLDCSWMSRCFSCCFRCFQGHYILATGFDLKNGWLYYNNPTYSDRSCKMWLEDFDRARTANGTDCDIILVTD